MLIDVNFLKYLCHELDSSGCKLTFFHKFGSPLNKTCQSIHFSSGFILYDPSKEKKITSDFVSDFVSVEIRHRNSYVLHAIASLIEDLSLFCTLLL